MQKSKISLKITKDPAILGGMPTIGGTRISVVGVLTALSEGKTFDQIVSDLQYAGYKTITTSHISKAVQYAGHLVA
jgi:uncharacterized protein (DUF433 family)